MQTGKIDVWNKIKARQAEMDRDDAKEMAALRAEEKKAKEKEEEMQEIAMIIGGVAFVLLLVFIGINELMSLCPKGGCGRWTSTRSNSTCFAGCSAMGVLLGGF